MSNPIFSQTQTSELNSPLWFYLPRTIAYLQHGRATLDHSADDFTPTGVNYTIIMLAVFYLEGCLEAWLRETICSVPIPDHPMLQELQVEFLNKIGKTTSPEDYNKQVELVCGRKLSELCPDKWEGFKALFALRGALAHGRMLQATVTTDGQNHENSFNGGYQTAWKYLEGQGVVTSQMDVFSLGELLLSDSVADHWVSFCRSFIYALGEALGGNEQKIFKDARFESDSSWSYPPR